MRSLSIEVVLLAGGGRLLLLQVWKFIETPSRLNFPGLLTRRRMWQTLEPKMDMTTGQATFTRFQLRRVALPRRFLCFLGNGGSAAMSPTGNTPAICSRSG